jgi:hypothetical protein
MLERTHPQEESNYMKSRAQAFSNMMKEKVGLTSDYQPTHIINHILIKYAIFRHHPDVEFVQDFGMVDFLREKYLKEVKLILNPLLSHSLIYRLVNLHQLSTVPLLTNTDAGHCRLSHMIGTAEIALYMYYDLKEKYTHDTLLQHESTKKALVIAAFIHDIMHGPFGHSMEMFGPMLFPHSLGRIDKTLLVEQLQDEKGVLCSILGKCFVQREQKQGIELIKKIIYGDSIFAIDDNYYYLHEIIDSAIDADRLDYIQRDTLHCGKSLSFRDSRITELLDGIKLFMEPEQRDRMSPKPRKRIFFSNADEHQRTVCNILTRRRELYKEIYEAPRKMALDDMICHAMYYPFKEMNYFTTQYLTLGTDGNNAFADQFNEMIREIFLLSDSELLDFLGDLIMLYPKKCAYYVFTLLRDIKSGKIYKTIDIDFSVTKEHLGLFKIIWQIITAIIEIEETRYKRTLKTGEPQDDVVLLNINKKVIEEIVKELDDLFPQEEGQFISRDNINDFQRGVNAFWSLTEGEISVFLMEIDKDGNKKNLFNLLVEFVEQEKVMATSHLGDKLLIYWFQWVFSSNFSDKVELERKLWNTIMKEECFEEAFDEILRKLYGGGYMFVKDQICDYPHVFLTIPTITGPDIETAYLYHRSRQDTKIPFYDETEKPIYHTEDLRESKGFKVAPMYLSAPASFHNDAYIISSIKSAFLSILRSGAWLSQSFLEADI